MLRDYGVCVVKIKKTRNFGRLEVLDKNNIPLSANDLIAKNNDVRNNTIATVFDNTDKATVKEYLGWFVKWAENGHMTVPFELLKCRGFLDTEFSNFYNRIFLREKPKGLSFHAFRRGFSGYKFIQGFPISKIQENLDHSSRRQTNYYVNSCLYNLRK